MFICKMKIRLKAKTEENLSKITDDSFKLFCTSKDC